MDKLAMTGYATALAVYAKLEGITLQGCCIAALQWP
jgi:hypothetical protein